MKIKPFQILGLVLIFTSIAGNLYSIKNKQSSAVFIGILPIGILLSTMGGRKAPPAP